MKIWSIVTPENEFEIEVSGSTLLYGQHLVWNRLIRQIDDFFNKRNSPIEIFEGSLPINRKDWKCFLIPYDAEILLNKITASSPLKDVQNDITDQMIHSPLFQELLELWEDLEGELGFINQRLEKWGILASLSKFNEKSLSNHIVFNPINSSYLSPLEVKSLLINIILEKPMDKKTLIIVELPELFADQRELQKFKMIVEKATKKGYKFLFVSQDKSLGVGNHFYKQRVIHSALLEQMKRKVQNEVPFYCSEILYRQATETFLKLVDNSISKAELLRIDEKNREAIVTIIHVIMYNLDMDGLHVPQGLEPNLKRFITDLR